MQNKNQYETQSHGFDPVYREDSRILILGSFPSVKSREEQFFYGHPQNRFWKVLSGLLKVTLPQTIEEKRSMLLSHHIALWDVIAQCDIIGSSDSSIKNVIPNPIEDMVHKTQINRIYVNGKTAAKLYKKYVEEKTGIEAVVLPSTSPANAAYQMDRLIDSWQVIMENDL